MTSCNWYRECGCCCKKSASYQKNTHHSGVHHSCLLYPGGDRFEPRLKHRLSWLSFSTVFFSLSRTVGRGPRKGHDCFLPNLYQFIIHLSTFHPTVYSPETESVVKQPSIKELPCIGGPCALVVPANRIKASQTRDREGGKKEKWKKKGEEENRVEGRKVWRKKEEHIMERRKGGRMKVRRIWGK